MFAYEFGHKKSDIEHLVDMLRTACQDAGMNDVLERLLSQPEERRHLLVRELLADLKQKDAPQFLISAFTPLLNDDVADVAWSVLYRCSATR